MVKDNDKLMISYDFVNKRCSFYYNGDLIGVHENLSNKLYPSISCVHKSQFECAKWKLFYAKRCYNVGLLG